MSPRDVPGLWRATVAIPGARDERVYLAGIDVAAAERWARSSDGETLSAWLGRDDLAALERLTVPKKRRERLAGRLAARGALAAMWPAQALAHLPAIAATSDGPRAGQPYVIAPPGQEPWPAPCISISHAGDGALAAASSLPLGVDVDVVAPRDPGFLALAFTDAERSAMPGLAADWALGAERALALCWSAKEAVLKLLGVGLRAPLQGVELFFPRATPRPVAITQRAGAPGPILDESRHAHVLVRLEPDLARELDAPERHVLDLVAGCANDHVLALVTQRTRPCP
jgi:phosphopantetheinyl transferase